jgi:hypothetical protein
MCAQIETAHNEQFLLQLQDLIGQRHNSFFFSRPIRSLGQANLGSAFLLCQRYCWRGFMDLWACGLCYLCDAHFATGVRLPGPATILFHYRQR